MSRILGLVKIGTEGEGQATDVMAIDRPDDLGDVANPGLTLSEAKQWLAVLQREIVSAQAGPQPFSGRIVRAAAVSVT